MTNANPYSAPQKVNAGRFEGMVQCRRCGKEIHSTAAMCPHCGGSQRRKGYKSKGIAALLAFFFGAFGVHRFYLGQWWGIFYLFFFWTFIPGFIALIEMIVFLVSDQVAWDDKYNEGMPAAPGESSGGAVAVVIGVIALFFGVSFIGILAAVAIPAYQDYTIRARVSEGIAAAHAIRLNVEEYAYDAQAFPDSNEDIDLTQPASPYVESANISSGGVITITFQGNATMLNGETIVFRPTVTDSRIQWDCTGGTLEPRYRPSSCRPGNR